MSKAILIEMLQNGYLVTIPGAINNSRRWVYNELPQALNAITTAFDVVKRQEGVELEEGETQISVWDVVEQALQEEPKGIT